LRRQPRQFVKRDFAGYPAPVATQRRQPFGFMLGSGIFSQHSSGQHSDFGNNPI